ncbi:MAG: exo-beta-1,3-glucanase [SAR86 cluster bacterium SAR86B]|uniref:Endo-1,3-beta-glucanase btgC n=1 Tax=SAR86 cluster bacterium SAR86B TaxID=1123867 RepID=J4WVB1_9GAMM|nr:MAG: exo-beta-1,3-glucanase [SAR86 cluster bacterium SAR86B]
MEKTASMILGNPNYPAISYGGYRERTRDVQPSVDDAKEDMRILHAAGFRILRTYDTHLDLAKNTLEAIKQIKTEDPSFEMYVMLGAWITAANPNTDNVIHNQEDYDFNKYEIDETVRLANLYPDIVKVIAVGNEAMVHWATSYFVTPDIILKWVNYLQGLKKTNQLPENLWITSSDDFSSWGGGGAEYHTNELNELIQAVDFISMHTYPFHNTHYNPYFWQYSDTTDQEKQINELMQNAKNFAKDQFLAVRKYIDSIDKTKSIHIGETGWATVDTYLYGATGSRAADEYKQAIYFKHMQDLCNELSISCFYFSAFDEPWKDYANIDGSENHFGLFTVDGRAKYALWEMVDNEIFKDLNRGKNSILKSFDGDKDLMMGGVDVPEK